MANIEKMSIRGIRSFSPDRDETIEFYSPLTMIVGMNGCGEFSIIQNKQSVPNSIHCCIGKTTLIEALKFVITGSRPPNCSNGQSFVSTLISLLFLHKNLYLYIMHM